MNTNPLAVTRKIRACEGEAAAQLVLEKYVASAVDDALERAAQSCEAFTIIYPITGALYNGRCEDRIRAMKSTK